MINPVWTPGDPPVDIYFCFRYTKILHAFGTLDPHFSSNEITGFVRRMSIWRQPEADLESPQLLIFKLQRAEVWKTWSRTESLQKFSEVSVHALLRCCLVLKNKKAKVTQNPVLRADCHATFPAGMLCRLFSRGCGCSARGRALL